MADSKGSNIRNFMCSSKHALRPPKSPFPSVSPSYTEFVPSSVIGSKAIHKPREGNSHHLRTSSESLLIEEQPSWLDDLLNEPETPVRKAGHRRSSSDSFTYVDVANVSNNVNYTALDDYRYKNLVSSPWGSQDFDYHHKDFRHTPFYPEVNLAKPQQNNRPWESAAKPMTHPSGLVFSKDNNVFQNSGKSGSSQESERAPSVESEKQNRAELDFHDSKALSEKDGSHANLSTSETDTKRAKQQFAQRSRVRKLQYIAELEKNVQTLQAEGSEVSAELEFLNQRNLILSMENKALKQRLDNLAQEQLIKYLEQDVLEREIGRLRGLYQQQQQPPQQQPSSSHRRSTSRDLDSQFANLSLKQKDANNSGRDPVTGSLRT